MLKNILITGANSYIGNAVETHLKSAGHTVTVLDLVSEAWRAHDFSVYDSVFHVAGIAHLKEKKQNEPLYTKVNAELPVEVAQIAKQAGVRQFIFMSSMSIYAGYGNTNIMRATPYKPKGYYGKSKLQADLALQEMNDESFRVAVLRPPMIFGQDCKGNFPRLKGLAKKLPFFPKVKNRRSMLYIGNLCEIVKLIAEQCADGVFFPQNPEYFCTSELVKDLAALQGKKLWVTRLFNWLMWIFYPVSGALKKLFGNLTYDKDLSAHFDGAYQITDNAESIQKSV